MSQQHAKPEDDADAMARGNEATGQRMPEQRRSVLQPWVETLTMMQQSVLLSAIRGADGFPKGHPAKPLTRFFRRCILVSAFDQRALTNPWDDGGGNFTGPSITHRDMEFGVWDFASDQAKWALMSRVVDDFLRSRDELPLHYWDHQQHAFEILGYKHPDLTVRAFWFGIYARMARAFHFQPESEADMDMRLSDNEENWSARDEEGRRRRMTK